MKPSGAGVIVKQVSDRRVIISGCSGGGKSTLVAALAERGFATVAEPGRRIVAEERASGGTALPWLDAPAFARRLVEVARADLAAARSAPGTLFFDRGLVDAAAALSHLAGMPVERILGPDDCFDRHVFLTPPWPEIYAADADRRHGLAEAVAEHERLADLFPRLGYEPVILPRASVAERVALVLSRLALA